MSVVLLLVAVLIVGAFVQIVAGVLVNLLSSQIQALLPIWARKLLKRTAAKMGSRAERCEEEWLAHLETVPGEVFKLFFAIGMMVTPLGVTLERLRDNPSQLPGLVYATVRDRGWWLVLILALGLSNAYPLGAGRAAAYVCLSLALTLAGTLLSRGARNLLEHVYDRCAYPARVGFGGVIVPMVVVIVVAFHAVPPPPKAPRVDVSPETAQPRDPLIFLVDRGVFPVDRVLSAAPSAIKVPSSARSMTLTPATDPKIARGSGAALRDIQPRNGRGDRRNDRQDLPEVSAVVGLDFLDFGETTVVLTIPQPLPSLQSRPVLTVPSLTAPSNLRVIGGTEPPPAQGFVVVTVKGARR